VSATAFAPLTVVPRPRPVCRTAVPREARALRLVPAPPAPSRRRPALRRGPAALTHPVTRPHLRLTRRGRLLVTTTAAAVITCAVVAVSGAVGGPAAAGTTSAPLVVVTVAPGQTLSQIAAAWAPDEDWRDVAVDIVAANHLPSQALRAGQELVLPARH
jgi:hypothetical protein